MNLQLRSQRLRSRRWLPLTAIAISAAVFSAACGSTAADDKTDTPTTNSSVTVTHARGEVTVPATPSRVVVLGSGDALMASALGATVVAAVANPSSADKNWPGTQPPLNSDVMTLDSVKPNVETIAAARPDIILATTAQQSYVDLYDQLTNIAPTIIYPTAAFADSGEDLLRLIGKVLGKEDQANTLISAANKEVTDFATSNPSLKNSTYAFGQYAGGTLYLLAAKENPSTRFLTSLGLQLSPEVAQLAAGGTANGFVTLTPELFSSLGTADHILVSTPGDPEGTQFRAVPLVSELGDNLHVISTDLAGALLTANPSSVNYLIDQLQPALA